MKILSTLFAVTMLTTISLNVMADSYWNHNGSVVRLQADGDQRTFYYHKPSAKVSQLGVIRNTMLFEGYKNGSKFYGTAHAYPRACGDGPGLTYDVSGSVNANQTKITMSGIRLVTCGSSKTKVDNLVFTYLYSD